MTDALAVPTNLAHGASVDAATAAWLPGMPAAVHDAAARWGLALGEPFEPGGETAWVAPARTAEGAELVLKVGRWHEEAEHEALALRLWDGAGAVRVLADEVRDGSLVLLLERCVPGTPLRERPEPEQDEVVARVLRRTWSTPVPAGSPLRPLRALTTLWADETAVRAQERPEVVDPGLVAAALEVLRERPPAVAGPDDVLLVTDLHAGNVLAAQREPWLLIDPKPYVGEAAYDVVQHLLNCRERLLADPPGLTARMAGLTGCDPDAVRRWTFARCLTELWWWPELLPVVRALAT
jgi:streptomycin 6-kinase